VPGEIWCNDDNWISECNEDGDGWIPLEECEPPLLCAGGECLDITEECAEAINDKSNVGCEYWAVNMQNQSSSFQQPYAIVVSNLEAASAVHVVVEERTTTGYNVLDEADVASKSTHVFMLGNTAEIGSCHVERHAFRVTSDLPIVAYQFNPYSGLQPDNSDICSNDGTLLIPRSGMGKIYHVLNYAATNSFYYDGSTMNVVAARDDTTVHITPTAAIDAGGTIPAIPAGTTETFLMQAADVVQLNSGGEISGTFVEADKPIAVFGGDLCSFVPASVMYCDHMEHQLFPVTTWGEEFVAARTVVRTLVGAPENDYWRIVASEDGTVISTDPSVPGFDGATLGAGEMIEAGVNYSFTISATAPIMVGQFITGHMATDVPFEGAGGDPAFALLPPTEQFMTNYVFLAPEKYIEDYLVITHPAGMSVELDDDPVSANPDCETEAFSAEWDITRCLIPDFTHTIEAADPVGITVWGYGGRVSYGYTGGLDLTEINPVVVE
jgi:hypothetical protein